MKEDTSTNGKWINYTRSLNNILYFSVISDPSLYPDYVLALHSSKRLLVEQLRSSYHLLADAIINLTLAKGNKNDIQRNQKEQCMPKQAL